MILKFALSKVKLSPSVSCLYGRLFLRGFEFLIKKYSVGVYSVIRFFAKTTRLRFVRLLHFLRKYSVKITFIVSR